MEDIVGVGLAQWSSFLRKVCELVVGSNLYCLFNSSPLPQSWNILLVAYLWRNTKAKHAF